MRRGWKESGWNEERGGGHRKRVQEDECGGLAGEGNSKVMKGEECRRGRYV